MTSLAVQQSGQSESQQDSEGNHGSSQQLQQGSSEGASEEESADLYRNPNLTFNEEEHAAVLAEAERMKDVLSGNRPLSVRHDV